MPEITIKTFYGTRPVPENHVPLQCGFCKQIVGFFEPEQVTIPVRASQFKGLYYDRGMPYAFLHISGRADTTDWKMLNCPICHVPFFFDRKTNKHIEILKTPWGDWKIGSKDVPVAPTPENLRQKEIERTFAKPEGVIDDVLNETSVSQDEINETNEKAERGEFDHIENPYLSEDQLRELEDEPEPRLSQPEKDDVDIDKVKTGKGKTIETPEITEEEFRLEHPSRCIFCGKQLKSPQGRGAHEYQCSDNPRNRDGN